MKRDVEPTIKRNPRFGTLADAIAAAGGTPCRGSFDWISNDAAVRADAAVACAGCPVKAECLDYAVAGRETGGVFGGVDFAGPASRRRKAAA